MEVGFIVLKIRLDWLVELVKRLKRSKLEELFKLVQIVKPDNLKLLENFP